MTTFTNSHDAIQWLVAKLVDNGYEPARYDLDMIVRLVFEHKTGKLTLTETDEEEFFAVVESTPYLETRETIIDGDHDDEIITILYGYNGWEISRTVKQKD